VLLALYCVGRILGSRGQLLGFGRATGGLVAGLFWLVVIGACAA
jgi:hypothetical protein